MHKSNYTHIEGRKLNDFLVRRTNYQKHLERLKEISGKKVMPIEPDTLHTTVFNEFKEKNRRFNREERKRQILQYNSKVFDRLVDISSRKPRHSVEAPEYLIKEHHNSYYNQKQYFRKVNAENPHIVKRIMTQVSPMDHKKQQQFYMETRKIKDRLEKFPFIRNLDKKLEALNHMSSSSIMDKKRRYNSQYSRYDDRD